jgi:hypothetical protein
MTALRRMWELVSRCNSCYHVNVTYLAQRHNVNLRFKPDGGLNIIYVACFEYEAFSPVLMIICFLNKPEQI